MDCGLFVIGVMYDLFRILCIFKQGLLQLEYIFLKIITTELSSAGKYFYSVTRDHCQLSRVLHPIRVLR